MSYGGFKRMTGFCKTKVPAELEETLEGIKDNEEAVRVSLAQSGTLKHCEPGFLSVWSCRVWSFHLSVWSRNLSCPAQRQTLVPCKHPSVPTWPCPSTFLVRAHAPTCGTVPASCRAQARGSVSDNFFTHQAPGVFCTLKTTGTVGHTCVNHCSESVAPLDSCPCGLHQLCASHPLSLARSCTALTTA